MKKTLLVTAGALLVLSAAPASGNARELSTLTLQNSQETIKTFSGTILKQGDLFILSDKADKTIYQLDDVKKASEYEGKNVKVTGTLDAENLTIHVQTIQTIS